MFKEIDGTYFDYLSTMIEMCHISMFSLVFPISGLVAIINNLMKMQVNRAKLIYFRKRPMPIGAENMGIWSHIFFYVTIFGTVVSLAVLFITIRAFDVYGTSNVLWQYLVALTILGICKALISFLIPDVPKKFHRVMK